MFQFESVDAGPLLRVVGRVEPAAAAAAAASDRGTSGGPSGSITALMALLESLYSTFECARRIKLYKISK